ncbi:MAG: substrate-binding domain-containing protein [Opitutales bacterium]|nr:substrate-binding domain-containing protein [Opitutales bacterium]
MRTPALKLAFLGDTKLFYFKSIFEGLENFCRTDERAGLFQYLGRGALHLSVLQHVNEIDGVLTTYPPDRLAPHLPTPAPAVIHCSGHFWDDTVVRVTSDDVLGGRMAARHLIQTGVASCLVVLPYPARYAQLRMQGFLDECASRSIEACSFELATEAPADPLIFFKQIYAVEKDFLKLIITLPRPVGIFAVNDRIALEVLELLKSIKLKVPQAVKLVGFDNSPICENHRPTLSSVIPDSRRIGFCAGHLLTDWILNGQPPPKETLVSPLGIEERESSGREFSEDPVIRKLIPWIRQSLASPIGVDDFAAHAGCSRRALEKRFRSELDMSPYQYLTKLRLRRAKELLRESKFSIEEIARATGFENLNAIGMAFRRHVGQSPTKYRKIHRDSGLEPSPSP